MQRNPAKKRFKRVLIVRQLAAQTAWLHTPARWHEGRVRWLFTIGNQRRWLAPEVAELAAAERILNQIEKYPRALEMAFGGENRSGAAWLEERRAQLKIVKFLARLDAPDLPSLARASHAKNPATKQRLLALLSAEALCRNALPVSPAAILQRWSPDIGEALLELCHDEKQPQAARILAALILGARHESATFKTNSLIEKPWRAAWQWGRDFGISPAPGFVARLLCEDHSGALAKRFLKALPLAQKLGFDLDLWGKIFAARTAPQAVDLMEAVAACESLDWQNSPPEVNAKLNPKLQKVWAPLQAKQQESAAKFFLLLQNFARDGDAATIHALRDFAKAFWETQTPLALWAAPPPQWQAQRGNPLLWPLIHQQLSRHILFVLREVQNIPPAKRGAAFRLLQENIGAIWNPQSLQDLTAKHDLSKQIKAWLLQKWKKRGSPILQLVSNVDEDTVRRAINLKVLHFLRSHQWRDATLAAWAFDLADAFANEAHPAHTQLKSLFDLLEDYSDMATARAELGALFEALRASDEAIRGVLSNALVIHLACADKSTRHAARMRLYLPVMATLAPQSGAWELSRFANAVALLDKEMRRTARENHAQKVAEQSEEWVEDFEDNLPETTRWLQWMADDILRTKPQNEDGEDPIIYYDLNGATLMSWILGDGDFARFQKIFAVAARRDFDFDDLAQFQRALHHLQNYPAARGALGYLYAAQPARIEKLLKRWGLTLRLGDVQKALNVFREKSTTIPLSWRELLQVAPDAWPDAAQLNHAQELLKKDSILPPGLQRVLDMPRKMQNEYSHLAARHAQTPRDDWAARLAMLERRLNNREELQCVMAAEIVEKLRDIAAHTMLDAIENQVTNCYRARLREVAGSVPEDLILDENWLNAVLLTADIEYNRKLLRHLLRALLRGETDWHQTHPGNVTFLQEAAARGVDTQVWQSKMPRRFRVAQGTFHLQLETHPLGVLQMGNYFDTCLSFGGINSFSTVANACELNKRVVFARDEKNRVVGRKLLGINADGKLIGFYTYTSLKDAEANQELRRTFARYCEIFAQKCHLEMASEGTVPRLFAEEWYDDGAVDWHSEADKKTKNSQAKGKPKNHATNSTIVAGRSTRRTAKTVF